jgi:hypothetical protein
MAGDEAAYRSDREHGHDEYTSQELLEQCQLNAQALILAVFAGSHGDAASQESLISGIAETFAAGWDQSRTWNPADILDALLTNFRSLGATVESWNADSDAPSAVLIGLPNAELVETLSVSAAAFRPMIVVSERLVARLGFELEWSHDADSGRIRLQVHRRS